MIKVHAINGKWTNLERVRQRKFNRYRLKYIVGMIAFGAGLSWLINS